MMMLFRSIFTVIVFYSPGISQTGSHLIIIGVLCINFYIHVCMILVVLS